MKFRRYLSQPYPFYYEGKTFYQLLGLLFLMALAFNYLFEPFHVHFPEHRMSFFVISVVHAAVASFAFFCAHLLLLGFSVDRSAWTIGKEVAALAGFLLLAGLGQFLVRDFIYDNPENWSWHYFLEEIRNTFLVGSLFIALLVPLNFNRLLLRHRRIARNLRSEDKLPGPSEKIFIETQLKSDDFQLDVRDLLYARSEGNYTAFFIREGETHTRLLKRIPISTLEQQLKEVTNVIRVHRSYLVNLKQIRKVSGNAQGYKLKLQTVQETITVSRRMIPRFEKHMQAL